VATAPRIDRATPRDVAELAAMRTEQGWHTNLELLRVGVEWEGARFFVIRRGERASQSSERMVAATFALVADQVGAIGNVVVRPEYQRAGFGRALMEAALAWQRHRGARSVLLDATVAGRALYRRLGFVPVGARSWFAHAPAEEPQHGRLLDRAGALHALPRPAVDLHLAAELDAKAYGGERIGLLRRILELAHTWLYTAEDADGSVLGYLIARLEEGPSPVLRVGPWVSRSPRAAAALLAALLDRDAPWRRALAVPGVPALTASLPGYNPDALMLWRLAGGQIELDDVIMQLDFGAAPGMTSAAGPPRRFASHPEWTYAWLSSMTL
jgi:GNAT superfamily N-acetyltransferase